MTMERGVLGVKKDPRNQMLFSFKVRPGEEWPSDDSGDSDFAPPKEDTEYTAEASNSRPKVRKRPPGRKKKKAPLLVTSSDEDSSDYVPVKTLPSKKWNSKDHFTVCSVNNNDSSSSVSPIKIRISKVSPGDSKGKSKRKSSDADSSYKSEVKRAKSDAMLTPDDSIYSGTDLWGHYIPTEALIEIFNYVVVAEGSLPFLSRASRVCSLWREVSCQPSLWTKVDLSYGWIKTTDQTLKWLSENRFTKLMEINLSSWKKLSPKSLSTLADNSPKLRCINVSYCDKLNGQAVQYLVDKCPLLSAVDLSFTTTDTVSQVTLSHLINKQGHCLHSLNVAGNTLRGFNNISNLIADKCPLLETLDISNAKVTSGVMTFNIERFQKGCPKLRCLSLANTAFRAPHVSPLIRVESPGLPLLEEVSLAATTNSSPMSLTGGASGPDNDFLDRLLKNSLNLKLLDLRGCCHVSCQTLQSLPASNIEQLYISQSSVAKYASIEVIMHRWQHSLRELDLSWNLYPGMSLDLAMRKLSDDPTHSKLHTLNLSGTNISCDRVKSLLGGCPNLQNLNLNSCRGLPRGMKREYRGKDLITLRKEIDKISGEMAID